jgi:hypothetical protein
MLPWLRIPDDHPILDAGDAVVYTTIFLVCSRLGFHLLHDVRSFCFGQVKMEKDS